MQSTQAGACSDATAQRGYLEAQEGLGWETTPPYHSPSLPPGPCFGDGMLMVLAMGIHSGRGMERVQFSSVPNVVHHPSGGASGGTSWYLWDS